MDPKFLAFVSGLSLVLAGIGGVIAGALIPGAQPILVPAGSAFVTGVGIIAASNSGPNAAK